MSAVQRVLVVGGGIAGLSAAIALRQRGIAVDVVEKYRPEAVLGIGIILQGNALRALASLGILDEVRKVGFSYAGFAFHDADGGNRRVMEGHRSAGPEYPAMMGITRPEYSRILNRAATAAGATIYGETTVTALDDDGEGVSVTLSNGHRDRYDIVIGADGIHSTTRAAVFGDLGAPYYSGQAAWRVNFPRPNEVTLLESYDGPDGDRAGVVPLSQEVMYMYVTDTTPDPTPPQGDLREVLQKKLAGYGGLIGRLRDQLPPPEELVWKPFLLVNLPHPWHKGRVIIIGDGAHATSAHLGQGGAMAIEDAIVLAEELERHSDVAAVFTATMDRRYPRASQIQQWSEQLCRWEIERAADADHLGITAKAFELVRQPI
ncbi:FAD-dependent oxidoreductase [Sphingopyxis alaskensis]|uniref:FAD-dependent oxidoreductase n=1 Tax=Sphingopyxis alaskensis TaxID=117207 RepID=UPI00203A92B6|nr:FAD-dependent oxidoreductase [Sphingopyxis alaskensis]MCM3420248.1 FAD-dependent monooxygenase [Sphingopyxis alaskensis]